MIITVWQSGGFAGGERVQLHRVDVATLPSPRQERIRAALDALKRALAEHGSAVGADLMEYTVEVQSGDAVETFTVTDDLDPANASARRLQELLTALTA